MPITQTLGLIGPDGRAEHLRSCAPLVFNLDSQVVRRLVHDSDDVDFDAVPLDFELEVFDFAPAVDRDPDEPLLAEDLPPLFDEEDPLLAPVAVFALPSPKV